MRSRALLWAVPAVLLSGVLVGIVADRARTDLVQFVCLLPAVVLAWSSSGRDASTEHEAVRFPGWLDSCWWLVGAVVAAAASALVLSTSHGLDVMAFVPWCVIAGVGGVAVATRWRRVPEALGFGALLMLASYVTRYVMGPTWAIFHQESPRVAAWTSAVLLLLVGCAVLALRPVRAHSRP